MKTINSFNKLFFFFLQRNKPNWLNKLLLRRCPVYFITLILYRLPDLADSNKHLQYINMKLRKILVPSSESEVNLESIERIWEDSECWGHVELFIQLPALFMLSYSLLFIRVWNAFWDRASPGSN